MKSIQRRAARATPLALALLIAAGPAGCGQEAANDEAGDVQRRGEPKTERSAEAAAEPSREGGASPSDRPGPGSPADRSSPDAVVRAGDGRSRGGDAPSGEPRRAPSGANEPGAKPVGQDDGPDADHPEENDPASAADSESSDETREAGGGPNEP
jgi:hypothetical protein